MIKKSNAGRKKQFEDVTIVNIKIEKSLKKSFTEHAKKNKQTISEATRNLFIKELNNVKLNCSNAY